MRWIVLLLAFLLFGCGSPAMKEKDSVTLTTSDGYSIAASYHEASNGKTAILLHQLGSDRHSFDDFAKKLNDAGYGTLAIDFRGHGQSQGDLNNFTDDDFRRMENDLAGARSFVKGDVMLIGASIGANTALNFAAKDDSIKTIVLLSPGMDYHGINIEDRASEYVGRVFIMASEGDTYSADTAKRIYLEFTGSKKIAVIKGSAHGTEMLKPAMEKDIIDWIG